MVLTIDIVKDGGGQVKCANEVDIPPPPENSLNMFVGQPTSPLSATERERHSQCGIGWIAFMIKSKLTSFIYVLLIVILLFKVH